MLYNIRFRVRQLQVVGQPGYCSVFLLRGHDILAGLCVELIHNKMVITQVLADIPR